MPAAPAAAAPAAAGAPWLIPALLGVSILAGGAEALFGGKPSAEEEELKRLQKYRMEHGLFPHERTAIRSAYTPMLARSRDTAQNQLARVHASRGTSYSGGLTEDIAKLPSIGDQLARILLPMEMQAKGIGGQGYTQLLSELAGRRRGAVEGGIEDILTGSTRMATNLFDMNTDAEFKEAMTEWMQSQTQAQDIDWDLMYDSFDMEFK